MTGEKIRAIRKAHNLTQKEFAKSLFVGQPYISFLESGRKTPHYRFIKILCLIYSIDENEFKE